METAAPFTEYCLLVLLYLRVWGMVLYLCCSLFTLLYISSFSISTAFQWYSIHQSVLNLGRGYMWLFPFGSGDVALIYNCVFCCPLFTLLYISSEASVVQWLCHSPCKPWVAGSIPGFSSPSDGTINRGLVST